MSRRAIDEDSSFCKYRAVRVAATKTLKRNCYEADEYYRAESVPLDEEQYAQRPAGRGLPVNVYRREL